MLTQFYIDEENLELGMASIYYNLTTKSHVFYNYFINRHKISEHLMNEIETYLKDKPFNIIEGIQVDEKFRNNGHGTELFEKALNQSSHNFILIADTMHSYFLEQWYAQYGFKTIGLINSLPVMVMIRDEE